MRLSLVLLLSSACSKPVPASIAEAKFLEQYAATYRFSLGEPAAFAVGPDAVYFLRSGPRSFVRDLYAFDLGQGTERQLLTAEAMLAGAEEKLSTEEKARRERARSSARGIASFELSKDGKQLLVPLSGRLFVVDAHKGGLVEMVSTAGYPIDPRFSPDAERFACARDGDLYVTDLKSHRERRLTTKSAPTITNGVAEFVAQEEMDRSRGYWWSPDSTRLAYEESDTRGVEVMHVLDPMHPDQEPDAFAYPRPGKANAAVRLGIVSAAGGPTTWVAWDREKFPYLASVTWDRGAPLTILVQNREQQEEMLFAVDDTTGAVRALLGEHDRDWLDLDPSVPRWTQGGSGFLWSSEKSGHRQLEMRDPEGNVLATLTSSDLGYQELVGLDAERAYVTTRQPNGEQHLFAIPIEGGDAVQLSRDRGVHSAVFAEDTAVRVHGFSGVTGQRRWFVEGVDGSLRGEIASVADRPPFAVNAEWTTAGADALASVLIRPRNFVSGSKYPVVVYVYGGPTFNVVQAQARPYLLQQWIADHGFIVLSIDGHGTLGRGHDWARAVRYDLGKVPLADQVAGLQALGERYRELDLDHVGIYGWSFGGYLSAMAALRRPDVFKAAVAGAPVSEWRDYDTHYTERYLGLPAEHPDAYDQSSLLTWAKDLSRPLLIIHGTADDNVYFAHSIKLSDALFRAGKHHEILPLAGLTHMVPDPTVTTRLYERVTDFFAKELAR